ncbi:hypothetical protein Mmc1_0720 [Magnetococcus marinus MC-1]|uniref:Uncharacterized protein n=1 Tax=Magnetococcus marinus (strain ATCC BAA-1437 / JCM 17883 / MC-1) TaxID=156889 RepID=A0L5J8_MAGMM|nr:hypothetical protein Mmc1_0720 [Magnetococcus marinus MC-1]
MNRNTPCTALNTLGCAPTGILQTASAPPRAPADDIQLHSTVTPRDTSGKPPITPCYPQRLGTLPIVILQPQGGVTLRPRQQRLFDLRTQKQNTCLKPLDQTSGLTHGLLLILSWGLWLVR